MKKTKHSIFVIIVLLCICVIVYFFFPRPACTLSSFDKRAVWISYNDLSQFSYENKKAFCDDFNKALNIIESYKSNTVIVQVRPFADALYQSQLFPVSKVVCHRSSLSFDPLKEMVKLTHKKGMKIEAWVNPYRISLNQSTYQQFVDSSPKKDWLNDSRFSISYGTHQYIMNPASQEVRDYIVAGIVEIVENYEVDGIHFDDYFYVQGTHEGTSQNQRLDNVNMLIQDVYQSIKSINENVSFGISPQGNYENCINEGADVDTWLKEEGYVDYVMPQIYWTNEYGPNGRTKMFSRRAHIFASLKRHSGVMLYAGLALYHAGETLDNDQGWSNSSSNISKQVQILSENGYKGYCMFTYRYLLTEAGQKEMDELLKAHPYH